MKITIYELLGLIKDGKAPIKIKYNDKFWYYSDLTQDYYSYINNNNYLLGGLFKDLTTNTFINDEVEIIKEVKKMKIIDLLVELSKGDYPRCFKYDSFYWYLEEDNIYYNDNGIPFEEYVYMFNILNEEVEIIDELKLLRRMNNEVN